MILLINYYTDSNPARQAELAECLQKNLEHPLISKVVIFHEEGVLLPQNDKITPVLCSGRPSYSHFFDFGSKFEDVKILANTDIYFNNSLLFAEMVKPNQVFALCRWEYEGGKLRFLNNKYSQDAWIWRGSITAQCNFSLGVPGCDSAAAHILDAAGYQVKSPSLSICAIHLHGSQVRNYNPANKIPPPHLPLRYSTIKQINRPKIGTNYRVSFLGPLEV